jgi:hypothetical protein
MRADDRGPGRLIQGEARAEEHGNDGSLPPVAEADGEPSAADQPWAC